ncbi:MAG: hypothetical protein ABIH71_07675 [Candidatus Omnitrophota bacterium]
MSFKIENVGNLERQYITDESPCEKIKIKIGGVKTAEGREKLKTFLKRAYDADSNGILDDIELSFLQYELGKEITENKLNIMFNSFFNEEVRADNNKFTPVMKKAIEAINKKLYRKMDYFGDDSKSHLLSEFVLHCKNPVKIKKISSDYKKLYSALTRIASRSDTGARLVLNILNEDVPFALNSFNIKDEYGAAAYDPDEKYITIYHETFNHYSPEELEETLIHECIHALDDIKVKDDSKLRVVGWDVLLKEINPIINKDYDAIYEAFNKIDEIEGNPKITENTKIIGFFLEYGIANPKSIAVIKSKLWMWEENSGQQIMSNFLSYYRRHAEDNKLDMAEKQSLIEEYLADAVRFYLSPDKSKRVRLKKFNPELYNFIEKRFLPLLLNNRRIKAPR